MNRSESKYFNTAVCMDQAFLELLEAKDFEYITVTEICERAGVNRSTFYLHYETVGDLLNESVDYLNRQFVSYFSREGQLDVEGIATADLDELYLITPEYLSPFLQYVKDHRRLFKTVIKKHDVLGKEDHFKIYFNKVFSPIMARYHVPQEQRSYMMSFYIEGIMGIIKLWLKQDCREPMDFILGIIVECIKTPMS